jgi:hypothetical protein
MMMMDPKPPDGQAAALVAAVDTHPEHRSATPLQRSTMPVPSRSWKPPSTTIPRPSSRWMTMTPNPAKPPGGQVAALVTVADTEQGGQELSRWTVTATNPAKPPDGVAAAPVADAGLPPERTPQITPSPTRPRDEGGGIRHEDTTPVRATLLT